METFAKYIAKSGTQNRKGKGDGVMFWQLLLKSAIDPEVDGVEYGKLSYTILSRE